MCNRPVDYSKNCYLGLSLGIEHLKAILIDSELQVTSTAVIRYDVDLPEFDTIKGVSKVTEPNEFKVNPSMYIKALDMILNCLESQGANLNKVTAIGGTAHPFGPVFWTETGFRRLCGLNPMCRLHEQLNDDAFVICGVPTWVDRSSIKQCFDMEDDVGGVETMVKVTGAKCMGRLTGPQIRKVYEEAPQQYERSVRISVMSSFLSSILVGSIGSIEYSNASAMNLMDIESKSWSEKCLEACAPNIKKRLMNPIASNRLQGRIADYFVKRWNFRPDCMVVTSIERAASMLSGLNVQENVAVLTLTRTDQFLMRFKERPQLDDAAVLCHPTNPNEYYGLQFIRNGSDVRDAVCKEVANGDWTVFNEMLNSTPIGNDGNIELRFDEMEVAPEALGTLRWDKDINEMSAEAVRGLEQFEDIIYEPRAVIEGQIMYRYLLAIGAGFKFNHGTRIIVLGEGSQNTNILQIVADVFNAPVYTQDGPAPTILGAAYRARYAFYEYREMNCNCTECKFRNGREPKISYEQFFKHLPDKLKLTATPSPGCEAIYSPLIERFRIMSRLLAAMTNVDDKFIKYK